MGTRYGRFKEDMPFQNRATFKVALFNARQYRKHIWLSWQLIQGSKRDTQGPFAQASTWHAMCLADAPQSAYHRRASCPNSEVM
ncbi:hypothetical protein [Dyella telluris]|uniref:Uncharacterized protein n=1 Tax=Dyella telluris TaxID=2763498 RepID=A0A7G8Q1R1_9GAMM|nr:hypothetical protein [Dyella telluris]QNK00719.1 hypothetical protein H8F01_16750 [Dyella telluris]